MTPPLFFILSLPRSRSAWMSQFLSYQGARVGHDLAPLCGSLKELRSRMVGLAGSCETGAVLGWKVLLEEFPGSRLVVIRRSPMDVYNSLARLGVYTDLLDLIQKWQMLADAAASPGALSFTYSELSESSVCARIFQHCLLRPFDREWWEGMRARNIQVDVGEKVRELTANAPRISALKAEVAGRMALCR